MLLFGYVNDMMDVNYTYCGDDAEAETPVLWAPHAKSWLIGKDSLEKILGAPKSLQMVTAAMKLKDAYSLEEKLWPT